MITTIALVGALLTMVMAALDMDRYGLRGRDVPLAGAIVFVLCFGVGVLVKYAIPWLVANAP